MHNVYTVGQGNFVDLCPLMFLALSNLQRFSVFIVQIQVFTYRVSIECVPQMS